MKMFPAGLAVGIVIAACVPLAVLASGAINVGATAGSGALEKIVAEWAVEQSVGWRAPVQANPFTDDSQAREAGLAHFRAMCVQCHGAPGIEPEEFALGLNPPAPALDKAQADFSDRELFWIVKHGIRMTGMPTFGTTHGDEELWKIVAFVRHLPNIAEAEFTRLKEPTASSNEHGRAQNEQHDNRHHNDSEDHTPEQ